MEQFYVGWGTLALINTNIAQTKNLDAASIFFFSLLFGPLVTFFMLEKNPNKPKKEGNKKNKN